MKKVLWALFDDRRGSVGQAKGVIEALEDKMTIVEKSIVYTKWASLPNWVRGSTKLGLNTKASDDISKNFPDIILSTSRRTLPIARYIRKLSNNKIGRAHV